MLQTFAHPGESPLPLLGLVLSLVIMLLGHNAAAGNLGVGTIGSGDVWAGSGMASWRYGVRPLPPLFPGGEPGADESAAESAVRAKGRLRPFWAPRPHADLWFRPEAERHRLTLGLDSNGRNSMTGLAYSAGLTGRLDQPGWRLGLRSLAPPGTITSLAMPSARRSESIHATLGYQFRTGPLLPMLFAGLARQSLDDFPALASTRRVARFGTVIGVSAWLNGQETPLAVVGFAHLHAELDQARRAATVLLRLGLRLGPMQAQAGPELILASGCELRDRDGTVLRDRYRLVRAGLHLNGIPLGRAITSISGGIEFSPGQSPRPYGIAALAYAY